MTDIDDEIRREFLYAEWRKRLRRYSRRYQRGRPVDHSRPWVKYSRRARASSLAEHRPGAVEKLRALFIVEREGSIMDVVRRVLGVRDVPDPQ